MTFNIFLKKKAFCDHIFLILEMKLLVKETANEKKKSLTKSKKLFNKNLLRSKRQKIIANRRKIITKWRKITKRRTTIAMAAAVPVDLDLPGEIERTFDDEIIDVEELLLLAELVDGDDIGNDGGNGDVVNLNCQ